jgi:hypothetical protein
MTGRKPKRHIPFDEMDEAGTVRNAEPFVSVPKAVVTLYDEAAVKFGEAKLSDRLEEMRQWCYDVEDYYEVHGRMPRGAALLELFRGLLDRRGWVPVGFEVVAHPEGQKKVDEEQKKIDDMAVRRKIRELRDDGYNSR